jgi:hypothetical protein
LDDLVEEELVILFKVFDNLLVLLFCFGVCGGFDKSPRNVTVVDVSCMLLGIDSCMTVGL